VIILTTIKQHTIFYAYQSLLDKYCENEMCKYEYKNCCCYGTVFSHLDIKGYQLTTP